MPSTLNSRGGAVRTYHNADIIAVVISLSGCEQSILQISEKLHQIIVSATALICYSGPIK